MATNCTAEAAKEQAPARGGNGRAPKVKPRRRGAKDAARSGRNQWDGRGYQFSSERAGVLSFHEFSKAKPRRLGGVLVTSGTRKDCAYYAAWTSSASFLRA